ncbi:LCP family protein [Curtobacterium pusillum]|uniref:LCP family protein n=1 Tax=Curtobacterium pusillum TaxID=69373 RepID=A0ABX2MBD9_9MICO|nr:LCP family protein [Curtobacterium pusillum]NUU14979.1 LCP family protein [Curtobacterium pusillum]GLK32541.1 transcriptional regulator [Curtobacterium pusillum]
MSERRAARRTAEAAESAAAAARAPRGEQPRKRRRPFLVALIATLGSLVGIAAVLAVVASVFVGGLARSYDAGKDVLEDPFPTGSRPAASDGSENILLVGSDSRANSDPDGDRAAGGRSDTLMLAHVPADRKAVYLMSIMRDSWVDVPGHGAAKINAAYSWGGVPLTVQTVEQLLDVRVDHVAEIDFAGFDGMTDALGGVTVQSSRDFTARGGERFTQGANRLDGEQALVFVRERYAFADADHTRVKNQQAFMRGVADGLLSKGTITNPGRIQDFVTATSKYLSVDDGLTFQTLVGLGWSLRDVRPSDLRTFTVPTAGGGTSPDGQSYVALNTIAVQSLSQALRSDDVHGWLAANPQ